MKESPPRLITRRQAKGLDSLAQEVFGISTLVLMENAGRAVAEEAIKVCKNSSSKLAIFCGKGNNGGDGFVAARHLLTKGIKPIILLAGKIEDVKKEAGINLNILLKLRQKIHEVNPENLSWVKNRVSKCSLIIDALLGVGLSGEVAGAYLGLIGIINKTGAYILAADIPSGLDADTGEVLGCCVKADKTVTFVAKKRGMVSGQGRKYCGIVAVRGLGVPFKAQNLTLRFKPR